MKRSREEHIRFCKEEAYKQYEYDMSGKEFSDPNRAIQNACTAMICDLLKHPETEKQAQNCFMLAIMVNDLESMKRFIDGFN